MKSRRIELVARPDGIPELEQFRLVDVDLPELEDGQILVKNLAMSVDPYMRRSMDAVATDMEPWPIKAALDGPSIGRVVESKNPQYSVDDLVESMSGWQEHFVSDGDEFIAYISSNTAIVKRELTGSLKPKDYLSLLGVASQTAYFGLMCGADMVAGETVVVSSGAGTVGSIGCQIAKINGMRVISSAGSREKVAWLLKDIGVDEAFNYKESAIGDALEQACPNGIDLVLENASPEHLSACLPLMNEMKTLLIAGMVGIYSSGGKVKNIDNFEFVLDSFLRIKSYPFMEFLDSYDKFVADMTNWHNEGKLVIKETIFDGLEAAPKALRSLFDGNSFGKVLVKLAD